MGVESKRSMAVRILAGVMLTGMSLLSIHPLALRHGGSHDHDRPSAATSHVAISTPVSVGCDHTDAACLAMMGCVPVAAAVVPTRVALPAPPAPRSSDVLDAVLAADLFKAGPPTPPPNR
jgi:hypothetical protein